MKRVGNRVANQYWEANLPQDFMRPSPFDRFGMENFIRAKYVEHRWAAPGEPPHLAKRGAFARTNPQQQQVMPKPQVAQIQKNSFVEDNEPSAFDFIGTASKTAPSTPVLAKQPENSAPKVTESTPKIVAKKPSSSGKSPSFAKRAPAQTPPAVPVKEQEPEEDSGFDFINEMSEQRKPAAIVVETGHVSHGQSLFPKKKSASKGVARFMKKPTGDAVINQMINVSAANDARPVSAPVKPQNSAALSMFAGLDFSHAKH
jgi:stromal membrane-associated protein